MLTYSSCYRVPDTADTRAVISRRHRHASPPEMLATGKLYNAAYPTSTRRGADGKCRHKDGARRQKCRRKDAGMRECHAQSGGLAWQAAEPEADEQAALLDFSGFTASRPRNTRRGSVLDSLEDRRDPLPATDAHGHQRIAPADPRQFVQRLHRQDGSGGADRMTERDPRPVRIGLRRIEAEILRHRAGLRRERLV